jgi:hypothetical protein
LKKILGPFEPRKVPKSKKKLHKYIEFPHCGVITQIKGFRGKTHNSLKYMVELKFKLLSKHVG